jgi:hypothetical protein
MSNEGLPDRLLAVREAAQFLRFAQGTTYRMASTREVSGAFRVTSTADFANNLIAGIKLSYCPP